jgi:hypothetical protein
MVFFHRTHLVGLVVVALLLSPATCRDAPPSSPPQTSFPVERFVVNLDLPPQQRWLHVMPRYQEPILHMFNFVSGLIPSFIRAEVMEAIAMVGEALEFFLGTYGLGT